MCGVFTLITHTIHLGLTNVKTLVFCALCLVHPHQVNTFLPLSHALELLESSCWVTARAWLKQDCRNMVRQCLRPPPIQRQPGWALAGKPTGVRRTEDRLLFLSALLHLCLYPRWFVVTPSADSAVAEEQRGESVTESDWLKFRALCRMICLTFPVGSSCLLNLLFIHVFMKKIQ